MRKRHGPPDHAGKEKMTPSQLAQQLLRLTDHLDKEGNLIVEENGVEEEILREINRALIKLLDEARAESTVERLAQQVYENIVSWLEGMGETQDAGEIEFRCGALEAFLGKLQGMVRGDVKVLITGIQNAVSITSLG